MLIATQIILLLVALVVIFGVVVPEVRKALNKLPMVQRDDPVTHCQRYVEQGCSHVDGMHCKMKSCSILKDFRDKGNT